MSVVLLDVAQVQCELEKQADHSVSSLLRDSLCIDNMNLIGLVHLCSVKSSF